VNIIDPINLQQQQRVIAETEHYIEQAAQLCDRRLAMIPVAFNLRGRAAGMYRVRGQQREIRYNPFLFAKYFDDNLANTVPHEVAHYVIDCLYGLRQVRPHGREWQTIMHGFGVKPERTCRYDLEGVPQRRQQRFRYQCGCATHQLTTQRHNKIQRGLARYLCRQCQQPLAYQD